MREERKKIWIDQFQTRLFWRILAYLVIYFITLGNLLFIWRLISDGPGNPLEQYFNSFLDYAPPLLFLVALLPILAWDALRFTHRLVGPLVRFRRAFQDLAQGKPVHPIKLRAGDFLEELRDDFNQMLETLQRQGISVLKHADPPDATPEQNPDDDPAASNSSRRQTA